MEEPIAAATCDVSPLPPSFIPYKKQYGKPSSQEPESSLAISPSKIDFIWRGAGQRRFWEKLSNIGNDMEPPLLPRFLRRVWVKNPPWGCIIFHLQREFVLNTLWCISKGVNKPTLVFGRCILEGVVFWPMRLQPFSHLAVEALKCDESPGLFWMRGEKLRGNATFPKIVSEQPPLK